MPKLELDGLFAPDAQTAFRLRHDLIGHPLLKIEALLELAVRLPRTSIQYNLGELDPFADRRQVPGNGLTPEQTLAEIERCRSWMVLKHVEQDPAYKALLGEVLEGVGTLLGPHASGMHQGEAYIFVSSPGSVTPLHMDPEHNVLWQIQGSKSMTVWPPSNPEYLPDPFLEDFYVSRAHGELQLAPIVEPGVAYNLEPGQGLHVPLEAPHFVKNGDAVSISFSTTWRSSYSHRKMTVHQMNARLRRMGMSPTAFGRRPWADGSKFAFMQAGRAVKRLLPRS